MDKNVYEVQLELRHPKYDENGQLDLAHRTEDIIAVMGAFNEKNENKKIKNLVSVSGISIILMFESDSEIDSNNVGRELSSFSRMLINEYHWNDITEVPNRLFLAKYCKQIDTINDDEQQNSVKYQVLDVNLLELDKENPRIKHTLEMYNGQITDVEIKQALFATMSYEDNTGTSLHTLKESIKVNGGVIHPIIVRHESSSGKYIVIEGNTRVQIYKDFNTSGQKGDWSKIPCIIYTDLEASKIDAIRLQAHLVGPRDWDPYSKAKYLDSLYRDGNLTIAQIVEFCGGNKQSVNSYIDGYNLMETHYRPQLDSDDNFIKSCFSAFIEVQNKQLQTTMANQNITMDCFAKWVIDGKFSPLNTIRQLARVLENKDAKESFLKPGNTIKKAIEVLNVNAVNNSGLDFAKISIEELGKEFLKKVRAMPYSEYSLLVQGKSPEREVMLLDLRDELNTLCVGFNNF